MGNCWYLMNCEWDKGPTDFAHWPNHRKLAALLSYKEQLGLRPDQPFAPTCSACSPVWYDKAGNYGIGPNPDPKPGRGLWHGEFDQHFLPPGEFVTDGKGNCVHRVTGKDCTEYINATAQKEP